jgi:DnaD/phage-associated family protein
MPDGKRFEIPAQDAERLVAAHDANVALLYIYRLSTGCADDERTARDLCMTLNAVRETSEKLNRLIRQAESAEKLADIPEAFDERPQYTAEDIKKKAESDPAFSAICKEARRIMSKLSLNSAEMGTILEIYEYYGMPPEVLLLLFNRVAAVYERKYGAQRLPTMNAIRNEALSWAKKEIFTIEAAEKYIEWADKRVSDIGRVREVLGIRGRELVKTEREYINSWLDMGFSENTIAIAYERTVTNTGALKWKYMDKIIRSWKEKNLMTPQEIEEKDGKRGSAASSSGKTNGGEMSKYFDALDDALKKI